MRKNIQYIAIFLIIILLIMISLLMKLNKENTIIDEKSTIAEETEIKNKEEDPLVVILEKNDVQEQQTEEPEPEPVKDAATLTQEIYNMNSEIGTLYIPKTGLTTQIYSNVTVEKMEQMPCFLYTTGGLNNTGVTLFVGHNRRNGTLFSNNNNLKEGDEFYFKDYEGTELKYIVYSKFVTEENDTSFLRNPVDSPVIALSCCTDADDENRIIILGRAD